jgi:hypothetical protein
MLINIRQENVLLLHYKGKLLEGVYGNILVESAGFTAEGDMPCYRQLEACLQPLRPGFYPKTAHVEFVVNTVALWQDSLPVL